MVSYYKPIADDYDDNSDIYIYNQGRSGSTTGNIVTLILAQDFAVVAWGCLYSANSAKHFNTTELRHFIRTNAMKAPAVHVESKGSFGEGLVDPARIVSDKHESELCPSEQVMLKAVPFFGLSSMEYNLYYKECWE